MINNSICFEETKDEIRHLDLSDETKYKLLSVLNKDINKSFNEITICGYSLDEIITILNGLEIERITDIKMTMENLSYLFEKVCDEQNKLLQMQVKEMMFGGNK